MTNKWIIYFGGNGEVMEGSWNGGLSIAHALGANLVMYNPHGVGSSTGVVRSADGLRQDAKSVVEFVANLIEVKRWGVPPSVANAHQLAAPTGDRGRSFFSNVMIERNFMLFGHSIGGGMASFIAAEYLPDAPLVLDRTFSSLLDATKALSPIPLPALVEFVVPRVFGDMDNAAAWNRLARSSPQNLPRRLIIYSEADKIIGYKECSLARLVGSPALVGADTRVLRIEGSVADSHNSQLWQFHNADIIKRHLTDLFSAK